MYFSLYIFCILYILRIVYFTRGEKFWTQSGGGGGGGGGGGERGGGGGKTERWKDGQTKWLIEMQGRI